MHALDSSSQISKALYGPGDQRKEIYALDQCGLEPKIIQQITQQADNVACMVNKLSLIKDPVLKKFTVRFPNDTLGQTMNLGEKELFHDQITLAFGTAFLAIDDCHAITAAHCVCKANSDDLDLVRIKKTRLVFGFRLQSSTQCKTEFKKKKVYKFQVVAHKFSRYPQKWADWALLRLKKAKDDGIPFKLNFAQVVKGAQVSMLGYPSGLPLKWTNNAKVVSSHLRDDPNYFESNIDAFGGNSGSPVLLEASGEVVGILCSGHVDYEDDHDYQGKGISRAIAHRVTPLEIQTKGYEKCQRFSAIEAIKDYINAQLNLFALSDGLNFQAVCQNESCSAFNRQAYIPKKLGVFNLGFEFHASRCLSCDKKNRKVSTIVLKNCIFSSRGIDGQEKSQIVTDEIVREETKQFTFSGWKCFQIDLKQLNN